MIIFQTNKNYISGSLSDPRGTAIITILKRTQKQVVYEYRGDVQRAKIRQNEESEYLVVGGEGVFCKGSD